MVWSAHGETRSQPAGHPRRAARRRQRRARRPAAAAEPLGDEPGAGAAAGDDGRSAAGPGRARPRPHAAGDRAARAGRPARAGRRAVLRPAEKLDLEHLVRTFTLRTSDGFVENFGAAISSRASPRRRPACGCASCRSPTRTARRFATGSSISRPAWWAKTTAPELRAQALFRDRFVGVVRMGHPLCEGEITPARYAAGRHIVVSRRGLDRGPIDEALSSLGPGAGDRHHRRRLLRPRWRSPGPPT